MLVFNSRATYDQQRAYLNFQIFRRKKMYLNNLLTFLGLTIIIIIMIMRKNYQLIIAAGLLQIINIIVFILMIRKLYKINLHNKDFSSIDELLVQITANNVLVNNKRTNEQIEFPLDNLVLICELKEYLFLYLTDTQAICLDKTDISEGSIEELINVLPEDFKNKKYRKYFR